MSGKVIKYIPKPQKIKVVKRVCLSCEKSKPMKENCRICDKCKFGDGSCWKWLGMGLVVGE